jgi:hypothetical protein
VSTGEMEFTIFSSWNGDRGDGLRGGNLLPNGLLRGGLVRPACGGSAAKACEVWRVRAFDGPIEDIGAPSAFCYGKREREGVAVEGCEVWRYAFLNVADGGHRRSQRGRLVSGAINIALRMELWPLACGVWGQVRALWWRRLSLRAGGPGSLQRKTRRRREDCAIAPRLRIREPREVLWQRSGGI